MTSLRIGIFCTTVAEAGRKPGGVDVMVGRLAAELSRRGTEVVLYTYSPPSAGETTYEVRHLQPASWRHKKLHRMLAIPAVLGRADFSDIDVLHLHGDDWFFFNRPIPTVRTFHGSALHEARTAVRMRRRIGQGLHFPLEVLASRLATQTYGLIPGDAPFYRSVGELPCGIDMTPGGQSVTERTGDPTILFVGTWLGRKRGAALARAFTEHVRPRFPSAELVMVSDRVEPTPGIRHVPVIDDESLRRLFSAAWILCLPSSYEGFGIPYLEAMAVGTPVVCTPNPGANHILRKGRDGVIVELDQLGPTLAELLADEDERARLTTAGRLRANDFSWDAICSEHERAYEEAVARWARRPRHVAAA